MSDRSLWLIWSKLLSEWTQRSYTHQTFFSFWIRFNSAISSCRLSSQRRLDSEKFTHLWTICTEDITGNVPEQIAAFQGWKNMIPPAANRRPLWIYRRLVWPIIEVYVKQIWCNDSIFFFSSCTVDLDNFAPASRTRAWILSWFLAASSIRLAPKGRSHSGEGEFD